MAPEDTVPHKVLQVGLIMKLSRFADKRRMQARDAPEDAVPHKVLQVGLKADLS